MKVALATIAYNLGQSNRKLIESVMLDADKHDITVLLYLHSRHEETVKECEKIAQDFSNVEYFAYGQNRGLSLSWNDSIIRAYHELAVDALVIANDDTCFSPGDFDKLVVKARNFPGNYMVSVAGFNASHGKRIPSMGYSCFALNPIALEKIGMFDEQIFPVYCVAPETPILTADLQWIPIGNAEPGLRIIGVDEEVEVRYRRYRPSIVTSIGRRRAPAIRIIFTDGREVTCSKEHRWLGKRSPRTERQRWMFAGDLREGYHITAPLKPWEMENSYNGGWLAGLYDGEGSLHISKKNTGTRAVSLAQKPGPILEQAKTILTEMGIPFTGEYDKDEKRSAVSIDVNTRMKVFELLGRIRPVRLLSERIWDGAAIMSKNVQQFAVIERIEEVGDRDLVDISTTTRTFIANGLVSHNCEDQDHHRRASLLGLVETNCSDTNVYHAGSSAVKKDPILARQNMVTQFKNRQYLIAKWSHDYENFNAGYKTPFNNKEFTCYIDPEYRHNPYPGYERLDRQIVRF